YYYEIAAVGLGGMSRDSRIAKADALLDQRREMEDLDRGVVAVTTTDGVFVSWRLLATDAPGVSFLVFRNNRLVSGLLHDGPTHFLDASGAAGDTYTIYAVGNGLFGLLTGTRPARRDSTVALAQAYVPIP